MPKMIGGGQPPRCEPPNKKWRPVADKNGQCYYYAPFDKPLNGFVIQMQDLAKIERTGARCGRDEFDDSYAVCFNPGDEAPGAPPTKGPLVPALQPQFPELDPGPQPPLQGGVTDTGANGSLGTPATPYPAPQTAPPQAPPLNGGAQNGSSGVETGSANVNGSRLDVQIDNMRPDGYYVANAIVKTGVYARVWGYVRRNYQRTGQDYFQVTQLQGRNGTMYPNLNQWVAIR